jgi:hypothetical protein
MNGWKFKVSPRSSERYTSSCSVVREDHLVKVRESPDVRQDQAIQLNSVQCSSSHFNYI